MLADPVRYLGVCDTASIVAPTYMVTHIISALALELKQNCGGAVV